MSFGASLSMGTDAPRRFQMSMFRRFCGGRPRAVYTSLKRCRQEARSSSRLMYSTLPCAQENRPSQGVPSAMAMHSSMRAKLLPALLGPASSILWPLRSTPVMRASASGGRLSQSSARLSVSGSSSVSASSQSRHSSQQDFPMFVSSSTCRLSPRRMPGIRERREGLRFCWSMVRPFFWQAE